MLITISLFIHFHRQRYDAVRVSKYNHETNILKHAFPILFNFLILLMDQILKLKCLCIRTHAYKDNIVLAMGQCVSVCLRSHFM